MKKTYLSVAFQHNFLTAAVLLVLVSSVSLWAAAEKKEDWEPRLLFQTLTYWR